MAKGNTWCKQKKAKLAKQLAAARDYRRTVEPREVVITREVIGPFNKAGNFTHTVGTAAKAAGLSSDIGVMGSNRRKAYKDGCTRHPMLNARGVAVYAEHSYVQPKVGSHALYRTTPDGKLIRVG